MTARRRLACMRRPLGLALAAAALIGCGTARGGAVSKAGPCAQTIPLAVSIADGHGRLASARALRRQDVGRLLAARTLTPVPDRRAARACVLVFQGSLVAPGAARGPRRRYLILMIRVRRPVLLAAAAVDAIPPALRGVT